MLLGSMLLKEMRTPLRINAQVKGQPKLSVVVKAMHFASKLASFPMIVGGL